MASLKGSVRPTRVGLVLTGSSSSSSSLLFSTRSSGTSILCLLGASGKPQNSLPLSLRVGALRCGACDEALPLLWLVPVPCLLIPGGCIVWAELAVKGIEGDAASSCIVADDLRRLSKVRVGFRASSCSSCVMCRAAVKKGSVSLAPGWVSRVPGDCTGWSVIVLAGRRAGAVSTSGASSSACERSLTPHDHRSWDDDKLWQNESKESSPSCPVLNITPSKSELALASDPLYHSNPT